MSRDAEIVQMFKSGATLQEIANRFGFTRQRAQQITKRAGLSSASGGYSLVTAAKKQANALARDARYVARFGCTVAEFETVPQRARSAYANQRKSAKERGIGFAFTLWSWWRFWVESGHWKERGRSGYVMARIGDVGDYAPGNVYICTTSQNIKDGYVNKPVSQRKQPKNTGKMATKGWSWNKLSKRYGTRFKGKWAGFFDTPEEARAHYIALWEAEDRKKVCAPAHTAC